jgi:type IV secretion system protein VirD4
MDDPHDDGHRQLQLTLADDPAMDLDASRADDELLPDDDTDAAAERRQMQRAANTAMRGAHAMTRDDDDLLPAF